MCLKKISLPRENMTDFDLESFAEAAEELNRKNAEASATPFPKDPSRFISHYEFEPRPIEFAGIGEPQGGLSGVLCSVADFGFVRSVAAPAYSAQGGHCHDPASLFILTLAAHLDGYSDYAAFCKDLRQKDKGRGYREMAGIKDSVPGEDDLCNFRKRVGAETIDAVIAVFADFLLGFGLVGPILATDGQLEPSDSRYRGCAHFCKQCGEFPLTAEHLEEMTRQILAGKKEIGITCPFPEAVEKILRNTGRKGKRAVTPKMILLGVDHLPPDSPDLNGSQRVTEILSSETELPPLNVARCRISLNDDGKPVGRCQRFPSDSEAGVGWHVDTQNPDKKERVFGYNHMRTTAINPEIGLELPIGVTTHPADVREGGSFEEQLSRLTIPNPAGHPHLLDAAYDQRNVYESILRGGGVPIIKYNPRNEDLSEPSLLKRGHDENGVPYAPCGRLCRSDGYDAESESRQHICGHACPAEEQAECPHACDVGGYGRRMIFDDHPRLVGPVQRGTDEWSILYRKRTSAERTNSYDQEVVGKSGRRKFRGLEAFSFSASVRTLAQLIRKSLNFVLSVTHALGGAVPANA